MLDSYSDGGGSAVPCLALRKRQMAAALSVSERTLQDWETQEGFPTIRIGGVILYPVDGAKKWLDERIQKGADHGQRGQ